MISLCACVGSASECTAIKSFNYIPRNRIDLLTKKILTFLTANQMAAYRWSVRAARPIKLRVPAGASVGTFWADFNAA